MTGQCDCGCCCFTCIPTCVVQSSGANFLVLITLRGAGTVSYSAVCADYVNSPLHSLLSNKFN